MAEKPRFGTIEQRTTPQGARANLNFNPMGNSQIWAQIGNSVGQAGDVIQRMQERNDALAMSAWEQKLADDERTLKLRLSNTNDPEEVDKIYKEYEQNTISQAQERLGKRLYNKWKRETGDNYLEITRQETERAKFPIMQRKGLADLQENLSLAAKNRSLTNNPQEKAAADNMALASIEYAAYPQNGSPALINDTQRAALVKSYQNETDVNELEQYAQTNAKGAMLRLQEGYYKHLTPAQINDFVPRLERMANAQEQDSLFAEALAKSETMDGKKDYFKALDWLNKDAEKELNVSPENRKAATDMIYAEMNRKNQLEKLRQSEAEAAVLNDAYGSFLNGNLSAAVQTVMNSSLPNNRKNEIINNFKKNMGPAQQDDPETYNSLMSGIVSGEVYDQNPILMALAEGKIKESSKDGLLQTLKQKQTPSYEVYQAALKQVEKVYNKGLLGTLTPAESMAYSYIQKDLNDIYLSALKQNKSLEEIQRLFSPENVQAIAEKYAVDTSEASQSFMQRMINQSQQKKLEKARIQGESVDEYLQRIGGTL